MYPFYLELELIKPVSDYFKKQGYSVRHEVRIGFCRADLVAFRKDEVCAVELKLRDWKKAITQARNYQLGADYVYLAVPLLKSFNILRKAEYQLKKEGIGFLVVKEDGCTVSEIIKPKKSTKKFASITKNEVNKMKKRRTKFL
jgi:hypothetical protein